MIFVSISICSPVFFLLLPSNSISFRFHSHTLPYALLFLSSFHLFLFCSFSDVFLFFTRCFHTFSSHYLITSNFIHFIKQLLLLLCPSISFVSSYSYQASFSFISHSIFIHSLLSLTQFISTKFDPFYTTAKY